MMFPVRLVAVRKPERQSISWRWISRPPEGWGGDLNNSFGNSGKNLARGNILQNTFCTFRLHK